MKPHDKNAPELDQRIIFLGIHEVPQNWDSEKSASKLDLYEVLYLKNILTHGGIHAANFLTFFMPPWVKIFLNVFTYTLFPNVSHVF